jgi:hypothetical protein
MIHASATSGSHQSLVRPLDHMERYQSFFDFRVERRNHSNHADHGSDVRDTAVGGLILCYGVLTAVVRAMKPNGPF